MAVVWPMPRLAPVMMTDFLSMLSMSDRLEHFPHIRNRTSALMIGPMCSRYEMDAEPQEVARRFGIELPLPPLPSGPELRPTNRALVIVGGPGPLVLGWGLPASWGFPAPDQRPGGNPE